MSDLITVIIPVFNLEKYLDKCIDSVINQTYFNLEIFLIDDYSSDDSYNLCKEYEKRDKRIKVFHNEKNKGVSFSRNLGINESNGKYILFIDGDDYIEPNMIEVLYRNIIKYDADISMCNVRRIDFNNNLKGKLVKNGFHIYDMNNYIKYIYDDSMYYGYSVNKLLSKEVIKDVRYNEEISNSEDWLFLLTISKNVKKVVYDGDSYLYNYVARQNSASQKYDERNLSSIKVMEIIKNDYMNYFSDELKDKFLYLYYVENLKAYYFYKKNKKSKDQINEIKKSKKSYIKYLIKSKYIDFKLKIKMLVISMFTYSYYTLKYDVIKK